MSNPVANKRKGSQFEREVRDGFRKHGFEYERLHLNGRDDEGDGWLREDGGYDGEYDWDYTVVEAKSGAFQASHWDEAEREAAAFARNRGLYHEQVDPIVIVKRRGKSFEEALVVTSVARYFGLGSEDA